MGIMRNAVVGVLMSGGVLAGAYGLDSIESAELREEKTFCADTFEGVERTTCIESAEEAFDDTYIPDVLAMIGLVGVIGCGYLGYKSVKDEANTTGIVQDFM